MKDPYKLAEKYFKGLCTQEEAETFLKWYFSDQGEEKIKQKINLFRRSLKKKHKKDWDPNAVFEKIQVSKSESSLFISHKTDDQPKETSPDAIERKVDTNLSGSQKWQFLVASITAITVLGLLITIYQFSSKKGIQDTPHAQNYVYKSNPAGQKSTIFLKDGSQVILNSASNIRYPKWFPSHERIIELEGEAFFEVAKDANRPFKVLINQAEVTAIGTSFNVRSFTDEEKVRIGLVKGRIAVKRLANNSDSVALNPGEGVVYNLQGDGEMIKVNIDTDKLTAWKNGILYFEDEPIEQVLKTLERWYGVEFLVEGEVKGIFTGKFENQSLEAVLIGISYSFSLDFSINGKYVQITSKNNKK